MQRLRIQWIEVCSVQTELAGPYILLEIYKSSLKICRCLYSIFINLETGTNFMQRTGVDTSQDTLKSHLTLSVLRKIMPTYIRHWEILFKHISIHDNVYAVYRGQHGELPHISAL
jgi:hypothetical protein